MIRERQHNMHETCENRPITIIHHPFSRAHEWVRQPRWIPITNHEGRNLGEKKKNIDKNERKGKEASLGVEERKENTGKTSSRRASGGLVGIPFCNLGIGWRTAVVAILNYVQIFLPNDPGKSEKEE